MLSPKATQQPAQHAHDTEQKVLLLAGVMQGVALVTFPAISTVLTGHDGFGLSSSSYGLIFLPQVIAAITSSFLGGKAARRLGAKNVLMLGLGSDALAMAVLLLSSLVMHQSSLSMPLLLMATALMGFGFGGVVPLLNTYVAAFQPERIDQAVLTLNALLGLGTALAPALAALVVGPGIWWLLPLLVLVTALLLLGVCSQMPLIMPEASPQEAQSNDSSRRQGAPLVMFLVVAALYGLNETLNGNWASLMMSSRLNSPPAQAALALTLFWALVTTGRLLFARFARLFPPRLLLVALPGLLAVVFLGISRLSPGETTAGLALFALAGVGCSALLPLIISYGEQQLPQLGQSAAGILIAVYQLGYGLSAFGGGALQESLHLPMQSLFGWGALLAVLQGIFSFPISVRAKGSHRA
jgi:MFS family permease